MTNKELQDISAKVEDIIDDRKGEEDICHRVANLIRNLKKKYQSDFTMSIKQINKVLEKHKIDCSKLLCISGEEIAEYVENNVPEAEPLNE